MTTAEKAAVMLAAKPDGSNVRYAPEEYCAVSTAWSPCGPDNPPLWNWAHFVYEIIPSPPTPNLVPLKQSDIPPVCWIRYGADKMWHHVNAVCQDSLRIEKTWIAFKLLKSEGWQYSSDLKEWRKCEKEEK